MEIGNLVFTRKEKETFTIYTDCGDIVVEIREISSSSRQVRLSVKAPKDIKIMRDNAVNFFKKDRKENK